MQPDALSATLSALADPTRRAILARLAGWGRRRSTNCRSRSTSADTAITKHLKVLERAGLLSRGRDARRAPARSARHRCVEIAGWVEEYRGFWEGGFKRLDDSSRRSSGKDEPAGEAEREIATIRLFGAPREVVCQAVWTSPDRVGQW